MSGWSGFSQEWLDQYNDKNKNIPGKHRKGGSELQKPEKDRDQQKNRKEDSVPRQRKRGKDAGAYPEAKRSIFLNFRVPDNRRQDNDGSLASSMDCLVRAGIIVDDSRKYVQRHAIGSTKEKQPGVDIIIIEIY